MRDAERYKLHFGPYAAPRFRLGVLVRCHVRGEVEVSGLSDAPIPWPIGKSGGNRSLIVYGRLAQAIRKESGQAVAHWFGVTAQTITKWRKMLGIAGQITEGERRVRSAHFKQPWARAAQRKACSKARDPERREKIAAAKRGKSRPARVRAALRQANLGRKLSAEHRAKQSEAHRRRGTRPPKAGRPWTAEEDALIGPLATKEIAERTGRTILCRALSATATRKGNGMTPAEIVDASEAKHRRKISEAHKRPGTIPPKARKKQQ